MGASKVELWNRYQKYYREFPSVGFALDISRMNFKDDDLASMEGAMQKAFAAMAELERGAIANPDENRMVGHYWLRNPALAPNAAIRKEIEECVASIKSFAAQVHDGTILSTDKPFENLMVIGIGGSALGPQFISNAFSSPDKDKLKIYFLDNTDPDGFDRVFARLAGKLGQTMCVVVSKSGGTKETRNGMLEAKAAYEKTGEEFESHAVAVTKAGSELDKYATENGWLNHFPMWDWVGGRTSEFSAVGLLPAALQGFDIDSMLAGAKACDEITRNPNTFENPAALLALMWYYSGNGKGTKNMVVLPYKDRLELFSRYLQQLIMESLGKELDLAGKVVHQGITVLGNKGSTDQHSYIQQLRDGRENFFVIFIEVLKDRTGISMEFEKSVTSGDYLHGFLHGTRQALYENGRESISLTMKDSSAFSVGALIALFERTVGFYASLVNVNAYHQPGVEAGKKAASSIIALVAKASDLLKTGKGKPMTASEIAEGIGASDEVENVYKICERLAANTDRGVTKTDGSSPSKNRYASNR